ncbi:hypothetical protein CISIN_1g035077mg [Citrus sinensis]|uniref:Uncharacterized protein n=1 Tax=Citrus sinensis TaxID=2711 RepID=A0A067EZ28_CITSI|nr:hypothetical protein CISIN_1g035077mg [Citrus sinensis]
MTSAARKLSYTINNIYIHIFYRIILQKTSRGFHGSRIPYIIFLSCFVARKLSTQAKLTIQQKITTAQNFKQMSQ